MIRLFANASYDFIKWRRWAYGITAAILLIGVAFLAVRGLNYSIEFTGGTLVQIETPKRVTTADLRHALDAAGILGAEIQTFGADTAFTIRARIGAEAATSTASTEAVAAAVERALDTALGAGQYTVVRTEAIGPKVGRELQGKALLAILFSFVVTLTYLAMRFEWRFGLAAVLATAHDILTTIAFIGVMKLEVSLVVVGAVLTVVGYSLNDTIIIFDRVRENLHKYRRQNLYEILNLSINETLPRSVLTHGTTMAATLALALFAGEVIRPFALVMTFGVFTGTFSSIYIAAPILLLIEKRWPGEDARGARALGARAPTAGATAPAPQPPPPRAPPPAGASGRRWRRPRPHLVDTHCHLGDQAFDEDREAVLERARAAGVGHVVVIGESVAGSERAAALARAIPGLSATAGVHPHDAKSWSGESETQLRALLAAPEVVAVGETGLDYHYDHSPRDAQRRAFEAQLALAAELGKPVVVHAREGDGDVAALVRVWGGKVPAVILHSFSSGGGLWEAGMAIGAYFSFSGMITFKNWTLTDRLTACPLDRLLVETDAPFLAPVPHRGRRNEPAFVRDVAVRAAALRGEPAETVAERTAANARRCFGTRLETAL